MWLLTLVLWGCGDPCPESTTVDSVSASCDGSGWHYIVQSLGFATSAELRVVQSALEPVPIWVEQHTLDVVDTDADACMDTLGRDLPVVGSWELQSSDTSTLFTCEDEVWLNFEVAVRDSAGEVSDCVVLGHFPDDIGDPECRRLH